MDFKKIFIIFVILICLIIAICFIIINNKKNTNEKNNVEERILNNSIDEHLTEIYKSDPDYFEREEDEIVNEPIESQNYVSDLGI